MTISIAAILRWLRDEYSGFSHVVWIGRRYGFAINGLGAFGRKTTPLEREGLEGIGRPYRSIEKLRKSSPLRLDGFRFEASPFRRDNGAERQIAMPADELARIFIP